MLREGQGWGIVNDISVTNDLNAILVPFLSLIPGVVTAAINILAYYFNRLLHHIMDLFCVQARDLEIMHSILMRVLFEILLLKIAVNFVGIGSN